MDYEKAYKAVLETATNWIKDGCTDKEKICLESVFPELRESKDVEIIEKIIDCLNRAVDAKYITLADRVKCLAYLAEPKEVFKYGRGLYYYDGEKATYYCSPATEENPDDSAMSQQEKQKKQTIKTDACGFPIRDEGESACSYLERCLAPDMRSIWYEACKEIKEKLKPTEWSEKDEEMARFYEGHNNKYDYMPLEFKDCLINRLKSIRRSKEDERIRKDIIEHFRYEIEELSNKGEEYEAEIEELSKYVSYLEKQKEPRDYRKLYKGVSQSEWFKQNYEGKSLGEEQKPVKIRMDNPNIQKVDPDVKVTTSDSSASGDELLYVSNKSYNIGYRDGKREAESKQEWSEEDEKIRKTLLDYYKKALNDYTCVKWLNGITYDEICDWLKSLRPQPIQVKESYKDGFQTARHVAASAFMEYCNKNRPNGKMCLSNGECEDIENAFSVGDWAKIERYIHKYHWKPSEEQMDALNYAYCELFKREDVGHNILGPLQKLCDELKKLM